MAHALLTTSGGAVVLAALVAAPAAAEDMPVLGLWGGPECRQPVEIGSLRLRTEERTCDVTAIVALGETGVWALRLDCAGSVADLVPAYDRTGDRLWLWDGPDRTAPRLMTRCAD